MNNNRLYLAATIGNILEWYDFMLYSAFTPVIALLFFPTHNTFIALIATLGAFAAGCLVRPLGGLLFGYLGDTKNRSTALD